MTTVHPNVLVHDMNLCNTMCEGVLDKVTNDREEGNAWSRSCIKQPRQAVLLPARYVPTEWIWVARGVSLSYTRRCFHLRYVRELYACSTNRSTSVDIKYIESCANLLACDNQGSNEKQGRFWNIRAFSEHVRSRKRERYTLTKERLRIMMARHRNITKWKIVNSEFRVWVRGRDALTLPAFHIMRLMRMSASTLPKYIIESRTRMYARFGVWVRNSALMRYCMAFAAERMNRALSKTVMGIQYDHA